MVDGWSCFYFTFLTVFADVITVILFFKFAFQCYIHIIQFPFWVTNIVAVISSKNNPENISFSFLLIFSHYCPFVSSANQCRFVQVCTTHLPDFIKIQFLLHKMFQDLSVVHLHWRMLLKSKYGEQLNPMDDLETIT